MPLTTRATCRARERCPAAPQADNSKDGHRLCISSGAARVTVWDRGHWQRLCVNLFSAAAAAINDDGVCFSLFALGVHC